MKRTERMKQVIALFGALVAYFAFIGCQHLPRVEKPLWMLSEDQKQLQAMIKGRYIVDTDWGDASIMTKMNKNASGSSVKGTFPKELWWENTEWAKVDMKYEIVEVDGMKFTRITTKKKASTTRVLAQIRIRDLPDATEPALYKMDLWFRGPAGARYEWKFAGKKGEGSFPGGFGWVRVKQTFVLQPGNRLFSLVFPANIEEGVYGVKHVRIEEISMKTIEHAINKLYADGYPENLVRNSCFPLGRPSGCSLRGGEIYQSMFYTYTEPDPDVTDGPSGYPTFRLGSTCDDIERFGSWFRGKFNEGVEMFSPPFEVPLGNEPHVASIYVKGKGEVTAHVSKKWSQVSKRETIVLNGDEGWQRLVMPFQPEIMAMPPYTVRFNIKVAKGDHIWFDAMQVEKGTNATAYTSGTSAEVQLAVTQYDTRIQMIDEPDEIEWAVTGDAKGAQLHIKVTDVYQDSKELPPIKLTGERFQKGKVNFAVFKDKHPYNLYRIEAWVERGVNRISAFDERVIARFPRPRYYKKLAPDSFFGIHVSKMKYQTEQAKLMGFNWIRNWSETIWIDFEKEEGEFGNPFHRDYTEWCINDVGMEQMPMLIAVPAWAAEGGEAAKGQSGGSVPKPGMFSNYVYELATWYETHFPGYLKQVEVWNEPYHPGVYFGLKGEDKKDKAKANAIVHRLHKEAYTAIKGVNPAIEVTGIAGTSDPAYRDWMRYYLNKENLQYMDSISYHNYSAGLGIPNSYVMNEIAETFKGITMPKTGKPPVIHMTEGSTIRGYVSQGLSKHAMIVKTAPEDYVSTSDKLHRFYLNMLMAGTKRAYFYQMGGYAHFYAEANRGHRALNDDHLNIHPTGLANAVAAWHLEDCTAVKWEEIADGLFVYYFTDRTKKRAVAALVCDPSKPAPEYPLTFAKGITVVDLFGNPLPEGAKVTPQVVYLNYDGGSVEALKKAVEKNL